MKYKLIEVGREKSLFPLEDELLQSVEHYIILSIKLNISFPFSLIITTSLQKNCYFIKKKSFTYLNVTWDIFGFYE